jgi:multidrug efflux system membrane fusion protein
MLKEKGRIMRQTMQRIGRWLAVGTGCLLVTGCGNAPEKEKKEERPVAVTVAPVVQQDVPIEVPGVGHTRACMTVSLRSRVDGEIRALHFREGAEVKAGALLVTLDDRVLAGQLQVQQAQLERDQAQLELARLREGRQKELKRQELAATETIEQVRAARLAAEATVAADRAALRLAELQLGFTRIHAPIQGRIGRILLDVGNVVKAHDTSPIAVLHQSDPMCLEYTLPDRWLPQLQARLDDPALSVAERPVLQLFHPDAATSFASGQIDLVDPDVDARSGTVRIRGTVRNPPAPGQTALLPGIYLRITTVLGLRRNALVVPTQAIVNGRDDRRSVYVVKPDRSVVLVPVTVLQEQAAGTAIAADGIAPGDPVVTVGQWRLTPGSKVALP